MTPQQINRLEKQLQQNHVDIQRLWKAAVQFPQPYVGMPMAAQPGGLTTDTTQTTQTPTTTTPTTLTTTPPPPGPCQQYIDGTYRVEGFRFTQNDPASQWCSPDEVDHGCSAMDSATATVGTYITNGGEEIGRDACEVAFEYFIFGVGIGNPPFIGPEYGSCGVYLQLMYVRSPYLYGKSSSVANQCYYATFNSLPVGASALAGRWGGYDEFDPCYGDQFSTIPCDPPDFLVITRLT